MVNPFTPFITPGVDVGNVNVTVPEVPEVGKTNANDDPTAVIVTAISVVVADATAPTNSGHNAIVIG